MADVALTPETDFTSRRRRTGVSGIASIVLLAAAFKWAHHWEPLTDLIVAGWAVATTMAFVGGLRLHMDSDSDGIGRFAKFGFAFAAISVGALIVAAFAYAAGTNPPSCGGG